MIIKIPVCYDISHYVEILDFNKIVPKPILMLTKATEAVTFVDDKFFRFFKGMKDAGISRGAYHFHRKSFSAKAQAEHFISVCTSAKVEENDILVLDVEEGGETSSQLREWFEIVGNAFPNNLLMIYSRKNLLDPIPMFLPAINIFGLQTDRDFFKKIPVWTAGYPSNPDLYDEPPSHYIPDQTKWGQVWLWQYSDKGIIEGIQGSTDLNWMSEEIQEHVGKEPEPPPIGGDNMIHFTNGATLEIWEEYGQQIHVFTIPPEIIDIASFHYTPGEGHTAEELVDSEFKLFYNFPPYLENNTPKEGLRIDPKEYHGYVDFDPYIQWLDLFIGGTLKNKVPVITHVKAKWKEVKTGAQGFRYVFEDHAETPTSGDKWNDRSAQRIVANDDDGRTIIFSSRGDPGGLNLWEVSDILSRWVQDQHGVAAIDYALQGDSGHSVQIAYMKDGEMETFIGPKDGILNRPPCLAYFKVKIPFRTGDDPEPPPDPEVKDLPVTITFGDDITYEKQVVDIIVKAVKDES